MPSLRTRLSRSARYLECNASGSNSGSPMISTISGLRGMSVWDPWRSVEQEVLGEVAADVLHVGEVLEEATVVVAVLAAVELALEVVIAGRAVGVAAGLAAVGDHLLHPPLLGLGLHVDLVRAALPGELDALGDVVALRLQHEREVELERGLVAAHDEEVRVAVRVHAEQRADAVGVGLVDLAPVLAANFVVDAGLLHLEAGGVDQQVEWVRAALEHWALRR